MNLAASKDKFRNLLKKYIKAKKIRQQRIAAELELTASAVSQMVKGKILFSLKQLNKICELLELQPTQTFELQSLLIRMRTFANIGESPFSRLVFALRCKRGLSHRQLSNLTGIPAAKLAAYEEDSDAVLSADDATRLAPVLGCEVSDLMDSANLTMNTAFYYQPTTPEQSEVAEESGAYGTVSMREFDLAQLDGFKAGRSVFDYTSTLESRPSALAVQPDFPVLGVSASAAELGYVGNAEILILVGDEARSGEVRTVLARGKKSGYMLLQGEGEGAIRFLTGTPETDELLWTLPVYETLIRMESSSDAQK